MEEEGLILFLGVVLFLFFMAPIHFKLMLIILVIIGLSVGEDA